MKIVHISDGWQENSGVAVVARLLIAEQRAAGHDVSARRWASPRELRNADEVWIHCGWMPCLWWASLWARKVRRVPHGCYDPVRLAYHGWKKRLAGPIERWCLRRASSVEALCDAEAAWIKAYEPEAKQVAVNDIRRFFRLDRPLREIPQDRPLRLLFLGRRHALKGLKYLEEAVLQMPVCYELHVASGVFGEEKEREWEWCDALVLPTLSENFGLVVAEALEHGRHVITTDGAPRWEGQRGVTYLKGYRDGTREQRVMLLRLAIAGLAGNQGGRLSPAAGTAAREDTLPPSATASAMNILFVWTGITGYMGDCWRALAALPGVRLKVLVEAPKSVADAAFDPSHELRDMDFTVIESGAPFDRDAIRAGIAAFRPDAMFIVGWHAPLSRFIAEEKTFAKVWKALVFDLPFAWTARKLLAPLVLRRYLRRFDAAFVPGAAATRYARWLGFKDSAIRQGLFSTRLNRFDEVARNRLAKSGAPHSFLYVGRYAPEKGLYILAAAYSLYRSEVADPWPLDCVGKGPSLPAGEGIRDLGFIQPDDLASAYGSHGVFILPSRFEPWGVVLAEACGAAMPVICSDAVGARHELVDGNGFTYERSSDEHDLAEEILGLAEAMKKMHNLSDEERRAMSARSLELSRPYSTEAWAKRVADFVRRRAACSEN